MWCLGICSPWAVVQLHDLQPSLPNHNWSFIMPTLSFSPEGCNTHWMEKPSYCVFLPLVYRGSSDLEWWFCNHYPGFCWGSLQPESSSAWRMWKTKYLPCYFSALWLAPVKGVFVILILWDSGLWHIASPETPFHQIKSPTSGSDWGFIPKKQVQTLHRDWLGWAEPFNRRYKIAESLWLEETFNIIESNY